MTLNEKLEELEDRVDSIRAETGQYHIEDLCLAVIKLSKVLREVNAKVDAITEANEDDGK